MRGKKNVQKRARVRRMDGDSEAKRVVRLLRAHIRRGKITPPEFRLSARKLAEEFGVSRDTTWRALRVLAADHWVQIGRHGGFQVHPAHWPDRSHLPICRVAFVTRGDQAISSPLFSRLHEEFASLARERRMEVLPVCVPYPQSLDPARLAGFDVAVFTATWARTFLPVAESLGIRTIGLECGVRDHVSNSIRTDFFRGGEMIGKLLLRGQPERAVVFLPSSTRGVEEEIELRNLGFLKAWVEGGKMRSTVREIILPPCPSEDGAFIRRHLRAHTKGTVYFATTVLLAHLVSKALGKKRMPDGPMLGTFDLLEEGERPLSGHLVVVQPNIAKMAASLAENIRKLFMSGESDAVGIVSIAPQIAA